jgi:hypothetical protein
MKMVNTSYDFPSEDYCWKSAGIYVYPEQKGVREKTLTTFCNGYGTCPQGPNAKCNCTTGILLEKKTCKRIDADYYNNERIKKKTNILSTKKEKQIDKISLINIIFIVAFLVGAIFIGLKHLKTKRKRLLLDKYHPVGYGSVEEYRRFSNSLTSQTIGAVTSGYIDEYSQVSNQRF